MRMLITGATGNVGREVISTLSSINHRHEIYAGVQDVQKREPALEQFPMVKRREFDFDKTDQFQAYLEGIDLLFLLRPPHISNVEKHFQPLINAAKKIGIQHITFLSVQGVEKSSIIPHHKIEKLLEQSGIAYTFLRPAYFMQNFNTTLKNDILTRNRVYLPAGKAKFNLIDVKDVGEVATKVLINSSEHMYKAYDLTNAEQMDFESMCAVLSKGIGRKINFVSPNLLAFFLQKRKEGVPTPFILVMVMLHYFPRFQKPLPTSDWAEKLLGRQSISFEEFVDREKASWIY
ncbi:NmrA family NAD(P)-binding protein [Pleomorphovibrio marinus]|uniref:NmrA family NAD(P)-binding protein n=1 Tax=Pleomorphovibrio marinus TaxID=2164132 RepID=UPI000E0B3302|nr:NmrA family NAD(P)-binding protein [Pleomorphovibrio marinus]